MSELSRQAQGVVDAFGRNPGVTPDQVATLRKVISASPVLAERFNAAVAEGHLSKIVPLTGSHAGGEYDAGERAIRLPLAKLTSPRTGPFGKVVELSFVLAHEIQHGFERASLAEANQKFHDGARGISKSRIEEHDYTSVVANLVSAQRRDEAAAEIAGWNAVVSLMQGDTTAPSLESVYRSSDRMADFIDEDRTVSPPVYTLKPNLTLNHDMSISPTPANIEAMGQNYFDKPREKSRLGDLGNSDYRTYYGVHAVEQVIGYERRYAESHRGAAPRMTLDMARLGLSEELLEQEGIRLPDTLSRHPYYDSSRTPSELRHFDHTQDGRVGPRQDHQYVPVAPLPAASTRRDGPFNDPILDRYYTALLNGGSDEMDRIAREFAQSPEGQQMALWGNELHEQQQRQERQMAQAQSRGHGR